MVRRLNIDSPLCQCNCHWMEKCTTPKCCKRKGKLYDSNTAKQAVNENFYLWVAGSLENYSINNINGYIKSLIREVRYFLPLIDD